MLFDFFIKPKELQKLPISTDMHCHIVPGVDDGSPDLDTSLRLLERMNEWGYNRIFASPHSTQDVFENTPQTLSEPFASLKNAAKAKGLCVELHHHMEYRMDEFFMEQLDADNVVTLPGKYILVENSFAIEPWGMESISYDLQNRGLKPILAHPERYSYYSQRNRKRYDELRAMGLYFQINLLSLAGHYGKLERETAIYLLENKMVQFLGTDIHRDSHITSIDRYLRSKQYARDLKLLDCLYNDTL